ncbi:hypothetical protein BH09BAC6_BH09BAC6_01050 [soil metagenome]
MRIMRIFTAVKIHTLSQSETIKALTALVEKQAGQIASLIIRVTELEQELSFYRNRKNSGNSHMPPSVNLSKPQRNQSLREKSDKKQGASKAMRDRH